MFRSEDSTTDMRKTILCLIFGLATLVASAPASVIWNLTNFEGADIGMTILVEDAAAANTLQITATIVPDGANNIGDIHGLFFNVDVPVGTLTTDMFSGDDLDGACVGTGITACNGPNNVNGIENNVDGLPAGSFHVGIRIGTPGIGDDDIQSTVIYFNYGLLGLTPEDLGPFAGRVLSVGVAGGAREGSSKLYAGDPDPDTPGDEQPIPEPSTWLMLSGGLALIALARKRRTV